MSSLHQHQVTQYKHIHQNQSMSSLHQSPTLNYILNHIANKPTKTTIYGFETNGVISSAISPANSMVPLPFPSPFPYTTRHDRILKAAFLPFQPAKTNTKTTSATAPPQKPH